MSSFAYAATDSATMLRRNLRHALRYPSMTVATVGGPVLILLLFNYAFGGALGTAIGGGHYIDYVAPGILLMAATAGATSTAVAVCTDMTEGIVNRFRTMAISRGSVLTGHVVGSMIQTLTSIAAVLAIALLIGFRPTAGPAEWLGAIGLLTLVTFALTWLSAAFGLVTKSAETASNAPLPLQFLPFLGSAIVPTDSMPAGMRAFAEHQPFTPIIETLRGLLMGTEIGTSWIPAIAWSAGLAIVGYLWARAAFRREPSL
jgi:ABC-2 type transport system permease protein